MSWSDPRTYVAGETITAAILNSAVRDNFAQTVMGTTATAIAVGSMGYVSSTGVLGRVLIGTAGQGLTVNSSTTAPQWSWLSQVDSVSSGVYALGQKQGAGANALRVEYAEVTLTWAGADDASGSTNWTNAFGTLLAIVAVAKSVAAATKDFVGLCDNVSTNIAARLKARHAGTPAGANVYYVWGIGY